jgi:hypothetical protein
MLCLLEHYRHEQELAEMSREMERIAGLPLVKPEEQRRTLTALSHRREALLDRFHRPGQTESKE